MNRRTHASRRGALAACALVVCAWVALAGCYRHEYAVSGTVPRPSPAYSEWHHHFLSGLVNLDDEVELRTICPEGVSRIVDAIEPLNVLVWFLTVTIYSPSTTEVYCRSLDERPERADAAAPGERDDVAAPPERRPPPRDGGTPDASPGPAGSSLGGSLGERGLDAGP